jgi:hypothetical protein
MQPAPRVQTRDRHERLCRVCWARTRGACAASAGQERAVAAPPPAHAARLLTNPIRHGRPCHRANLPESPILNPKKTGKQVPGHTSSRPVPCPSAPQPLIRVIRFIFSAIRIRRSLQAAARQPHHNTLTGTGNLRHHFQRRGSRGVAIKHLLTVPLPKPAKGGIIRAQETPWKPFGSFCRSWCP